MNYLHTHRLTLIRPSSVRQRLVALALALVGAFVDPVHAAGVATDNTTLTPADIAAAATQERQVRKQLRMPTDKEVGAAKGNAVRLDRLAQQPVPPGAALDLSRIAAQYDQVRQGQAPDGLGNLDDAAKPVAGLMVLVSLGMPEGSLRRLVADAERYQAVLILRGFKDGSMAGTVKEIARIQGKNKTAWRIDPHLFDVAQARSVPTYVLIDPGRPLVAGCASEACQANAQLAQVSGDVSIEHALRAIAGADPALRATAENVLQRGAAARSLP